MEYTPTHLILHHQSFDSPVLKLDVDMLKTLFMVRKGYPVGLLSDKYEQMISRFLDEIAGKNGATRSYDEELINMTDQLFLFLHFICFYDTQMEICLSFVERFD